MADHEDLCLCVAFAFGMDPGELATERDAKHCMRLAVAHTFPRYVKQL